MGQTTKGGQRTRPWFGMFRSQSSGMHGSTMFRCRTGQRYTAGRGQDEPRACSATLSGTECSDADPIRDRRATLRSGDRRGNAGISGSSLPARSGTDGAAQTMRTYRPHRPQRFRHRAPFRQDSTCPGGDRGQKENRASLPGARTICYDTLASFRSAFICSRATLAAAVSIGSVD